jgi:flagellar assembly protein FliH
MTNSSIERRQMTAKSTKFLFDTEFLPDMVEATGSGTIGWDVPPTREDLENARKEGFRAGHAAGRAEAEGESHRVEAEALRFFAEQFVTLKRGQEEVLSLATRDAMAVGHTVGRKLAETLVAAQPLEEIEALLARCLSRLMGEARIVLRVHDSILDALQERIGQVTRQNGYDGHVILLGDESISPGDCRIEWADGGAERDMTKLAADIENTVTRMIEAGVADAPEAAPDQTTGE